MGETKGDIVKRLGLEEKGSVDYSLPQDFVDDVKHYTGIYPIHCMVWFYPEEGPGKIFGYPYPLTHEGKQILARYNRLARTNYPIPNLGQVEVVIKTIVRKY